MGCKSVLVARRLIASCGVALLMALGLAVGMAPGAAWAQEFLPAEQAFPLSYKAIDANTVELTYSVAPGYYLYRERFAVSAADASTRIGALSIPAGKKKFDENLGKEVETLRGEVVIRVPILSASGGVAVLNAVAQGCADAGLCYPPVSQSVKVLMPVVGSVAASTSTSTPVPTTAADELPIDDAGQLAHRLKNESTGWVLLAFFGLGLLLALTPCVLPMVPILSAAIVNDASQQVSTGSHVNRMRALSLATVYVLGMSLVYAVVGVAAGLTGESLVVALQTPAVLGTFALVLALLGVGMLGAFDIQLPTRAQSWLTQVSARMPGGRFGSVAVMGALSALLVGPCVAPPLAGALLFVGQTKDWLTGGLALLALAWGMGFPLIVAAASAGRLLPRAGQWMEGIKRLFGVMLMGLALWTATPLLPDAVLMMAWGSLLVLSGVGAGALEPLVPSMSPSLAAMVRKGCAVLLLLLGAIQWVGVASGSRSVLQPLDRLGSQLVADGSRIAAPGTPQTALPFVRVPAEQVMSRIQSLGQPVMLDFYADWCVSCKEMEKLTFPDPAVSSALSAYQWLQVDVTRNTDADKALMKRFNLYGPPGIIFFDQTGKEVPGGRVIGFQPPERFLKTLAALPMSSTTR